jgi:fimbrial chaperone protein
MSLRGLRQGGFLLAFLLAAGAARAGSFSVSPVRVTLGAPERIVALTVRNSGDEPAVIQLQATSWSQRDGTDVYEMSRDLIATPPIFTVPAGGTQVVRVGLRGAADPRRESTYRLYLQEVSPPPPPDFVGTRVALRLGVPVFVAPALAATHAMQWKLLRGGDGTVLVLGLNHGSVHARIVSFRLSDASGGTALAQRQVAADLHAGQQRTWPLRNGELPPAGTPLRLTATTERGDVHADLVAP